MKPKLKYYGLSLLTGAAAMFVALPAPAQQITGTPGSPSATTTISGKDLPPPPGTFGGVIKESVKDSKRTGRRASCRPKARPTCSSS